MPRAEITGSDGLYRMTIDLLAAAAGAGAAGAPPAWISFLPIVGMIAIFWFLIISPQMKKQKQHQEKIAAVKKGDQVVTAGGLVGKVVKVDDTYVELDLGPNVRVKAIKATLGDIIPPAGKPAND
jgi:preprotein translocase subunit YajC